MNRNCTFNFEEMDKLEAYLDDKKIDHVRKSIHDGQQIVVFDDGRRVWDVVLHSYSYGREENLLEAMGEALLGHDDVEGYLTAEDVISYVEKSG